MNLEQKVQFSENQSTSKMSNTVIHKTLKTVIILNCLLNKKKKKDKRTMSGIPRSRLLMTASGKMCRRIIQSEFLAWIKWEHKGKVLKLQKALQPFSCVKPSYVTNPPETNSIACSKTKVNIMGKQTNKPKQNQKILSNITTIFFGLLCSNS